MDLNIYYGKDEIILKNAVDFVPQHIFECGQCFRWNKEKDNSFTGIAYNRVLNVKKIGNDIVFRNTNKKDFDNIWIQYFDLETNYGEIKKKISKKDKIIKEAIAFGEGIRILKQQPWETLISFIISANNNIPRIKTTIETLCQNYGEYLGEYYHKKRYGFPNPEVLSKLSIEELKACNTGYRASYIKETASRINQFPKELEEIKKLNLNDCQKKLLNYHGVGPKVAHCILFFSMGKRQAFPVDVWVKRVMEYFYFHKETSLEEIQKFALDKFGEYAGFAQQYLFYYARELGIGKK